MWKILFNSRFREKRPILICAKSGTQLLENSVISDHYFKRKAFLKKHVCMMGERCFI